jgi:hypothetical protein
MLPWGCAPGDNIDSLAEMGTRTLCEIAAPVCSSHPGEKRPASNLSLMQQLRVPRRGTH